MPANYFDERIARSYEARWPELFEPAAIDPVVAFLAGPARWVNGQVLYANGGIA